MAETVKVVRDGPRGWHLINKQYFDPKKHVLWEEAKEEGKEAVEEAKRAAKEAEKEAKRAAAEAAKKAAEEAAKLNQPAQDK